MWGDPQEEGKDEHSKLLNSMGKGFCSCRKWQGSLFTGPDPSGYRSSSSGKRWQARLHSSMEAGDEAGALPE